MVDLKVKLALFLPVTARCCTIEVSRFTRKPLYKSFNAWIGPKGFDAIIMAGQFSFGEQTVDFTVANGMQHHGLASAFQSRDQMVLFASLAKWPVA